MSIDKTLLGAATGLSELPLYPIRTLEVDRNGTSSGSPSSNGTGPGNGLAQLAKNAIRASLGWQQRGGDTTANLKSFQAALGKAFRFKEVDGATQWEWVPQGFSVQADLGEITGAQASIYRQAKAMLEQTLPVLEKIEPLRENADKDDVETMRSLIESELRELVDELGRPGGPRVQRIDNYFCLLIAAKAGDNDVIYDPSAHNFGGQLRRFLQRLGMSENRVNTIEEEVRYTDFLLVVDNVASLHRSWLQKRPYFNGDAGPFFGTLLMQLSQQMDVIAESVHELCATLDSVYVGAAERQIVDLGSHVVFVDLATNELPAAGFLTTIQAKNAGVLSNPATTTDTLKNTWGLRAEIHPAVTAILNQITQSKDLPDALQKLRSLVYLDKVDPDSRPKILVTYGLALESVGAEARSLSLDGLLTWIESFVTSEGRKLLETGGKDGANTFAHTICKLAEYVRHLLNYSAQYTAELHTEIGSALTKGKARPSTILDFHPGLHTSRVYRAIRELHTHLNAACRFACKVDYKAAIGRDDPEVADYDCDDCGCQETAPTIPQTQRSFRNGSLTPDQFRGINSGMIVSSRPDLSTIGYSSTGARTTVAPLSAKTPQIQSPPAAPAKPSKKTPVRPKSIPVVTKKSPKKPSTPAAKKKAAGKPAKKSRKP